MTILADGRQLLTDLGILPYILGAATVGIGAVIWRAFRRG